MSRSGMSTAVAVLIGLLPPIVNSTLEGGDVPAIPGLALRPPPARDLIQSYRAGADPATEHEAVPSGVGRIRGIATDQSGQPLANVLVIVRDVYGYTAVTVRHRTDQYGRYSMPVREGSYQIAAFVNRSYLGQTWWLLLHPTDDDANLQVDASSTVTKNFEWLLQGTVPLVGENATPFYYGATIQIVAPQGSDMWTYVQQPDQTVVRFILNPRGPLVDGSYGKRLKFERTVADLSVRANDNSSLKDIPLGSYQIAAFIFFPNGTWYRLPVGTAQGTTVQFAPDRQWSFHYWVSNIETAEVYIRYGGQ